MKKFLAAPVLAGLLALGGCDLFSGPDTETVQNGNLPDKTFWAYNFIGKRYYQVTAASLAVGQHCIIYKDKNAAADVTAAKALAQEFDSNMYGLIVDNFGAPLDVDDNGKIILLLLDILDGGNKNDGYTAGYFWSGNMYQKSSDSKNTAYYSNEADMLYIDTNPGVVNDESCRSTVVHEMQHLVNFSAWAADETKQYTDTWIDEGLSTAA
ncbi:MAG: hypothetical protein LBG76_10800, partial [Treponema sp.]|nr:hypothetical protein [Treponema sp.]